MHGDIFQCIFSVSSFNSTYVTAFNVIALHIDPNAMLHAEGRIHQHHREQVAIFKIPLNLWQRGRGGGKVRCQGHVKVEFGGLGGDGGATRGVFPCMFGNEGEN